MTVLTSVKEAATARKVMKYDVFRMEGLRRQGVVVVPVTEVRRRFTCSESFNLKLPVLDSHWHPP